MQRHTSNLDVMMCSFVRQNRQIGWLSRVVKCCSRYRNQLMQMKVPYRSYHRAAPALLPTAYGNLQRQSTVPHLCLQSNIARNVTNLSLIAFMLLSTSRLHMQYNTIKYTIYYLQMTRPAGKPTHKCTNAQICMLQELQSRAELKCSQGMSSV